MKKINQILVLVVVSLLFYACPPDENDLHQDCYTCTNTLTEYCINEGDNFYTSSVNGAAATNIPLNGEYWSEVREQLENNCQNSPQMDCFTCNDSSTTYCYLTGNDFYTTSVNNGAPIETLLNGMSWADIRFDLEQACPDVEEDCYTCESDNIEYCYVNGDDFYTSTENGQETQVPLNGATWQQAQAALETECESTPAAPDCYTCESTETTYCYLDGDTYYTSTVNGNETQTELNGISWADIKFDLQQACPSNQTASIVGTWRLVDFNATTEATTTVAGVTTVATSVQQGSQYTSIAVFTENPNEFENTGSFLNTIETTAGGVTNTKTQTVEPSGDGTGTWQLNGNILTVSSNDPSVDDADFTILELTDTTLRYRFNFEQNTNENGVETQMNYESFQTFERQ
jgi:hypothetical protein